MSPVYAADVKVNRVAIVGIGLRLPGASSVAQYWENLCEGRDCVDSRDPFSVTYSNWSSFDWRAFRLSPAEARHLDPHHRLLLETAWDAIEDAGIPFEQLAGMRCGVYVGMNSQDFTRFLARSQHRHNGHTLLGITPALAANRISHAFDLRGPSQTLNAGCASSLVALHEACRALQLGEIDMALVGSAELPMCKESTGMLVDSGMVSSSGRCRSLDVGADGYVQGHGGGFVLLKRQSDVGAHDRVYAVIAGSGTGHNGRNEWISAPSIDGQAETLKFACSRAGIEPTALEYVEMHGSALPKGDLAEARAISTHGDRAAPCRLGSVSNSIGYLGAAGGMAAALKLALSIHHRTLAATIGVRDALPELAEWNLAPQCTTEPWRSASGRHTAAVMATSLGGANAAVVMETWTTANERSEARSAQSGSPLWAFPISARTAASLSARIAALHSFVTGQNAPSLEVLAYTLAARRTHHEKRCVVLARTQAELVSALSPRGRWSQDGRVLSPEGSDLQLPEDELGRRLAAFLDGAAFPAEHLTPHTVVSLPPYSFDRQHLWPKDVSVPESAASAPSAGNAARPSESNVRPPVRRSTEQVLAIVKRGVQTVLELPESAVLEEDAGFIELGFNSLTLFRLRVWLEAELGTKVAITRFFEAPRLAELAAQLSDSHEPGRGARSPQAHRAPERAALDSGSHEPGRGARAPQAHRAPDRGAPDASVSLSEHDVELRLRRMLEKLEGGYAAAPLGQP